MFRVGQKVVCVNAENTDLTGEKELTEGAIYTVRWQGMHSSRYFRKKEYSIRLVGVDRPDPWQPRNNDCPFLASRFRPIVEKKTNISFAHEILRKATKKERA